MRVKFLAHGNNGSLCWGSNLRLTVIHRLQVRPTTNCATPPVFSYFFILYPHVSSIFLMRVHKDYPLSSSSTRMWYYYKTDKMFKQQTNDLSVIPLHWHCNVDWTNSWDTTPKQKGNNTKWRQCRRIASTVMLFW